MTDEEKCELLKSSIKFLYSKEGRSKNYISELLEIDRQILSDKINEEWKLEEAKSKRHLNKSTIKFINTNRLEIKKMLDSNESLNTIADKFKMSFDSMYKTVIRNDDILLKAYNDRLIRLKNINIEHTKDSMIKSMEKSNRVYSFEEIDGEYWKQILGFDNYYVSNMGRVKKYVKEYNTYFLLKPTPNKNNGRLYCGMTDNNGKPRNMQISRLVGFNFVDGYNDVNKTINHISGDVSDNRAVNLEWVSQQNNNKHAYDALNRTKVNFRRYIFDYILYEDKKFFTVAQFAKYLNLSETQTRRRLDRADEFGIKLVIE